MTLERAQELAVIATAQLCTVELGIRADVRVVRRQGDADQDDRWTVEVEWNDGVSVDTMLRVLDDPPAGVMLLNRTRTR